MSDPVFDFDQLFDEDYLYFYGELLEAAAEGEVELIWRLASLEGGMRVLDLACGHGQPLTASRRMVAVAIR